MIKLKFNCGTADIEKIFQLPETAKEYLDEVVPEGTEVEIVVSDRGDYQRNLPPTSDKDAVKQAIDAFYGGYGLADI